MFRLLCLPPCTVIYAVSHSGLSLSLFFLLLSVPKVSPVMYLKTCRCCCCSVFQESGEAAARDADINTVIVFFFTCSWLFMPFLTALSLMGFSSKPHMEHVRPPVRHLKTVQSQQGRPHMSKQQAGLSHLPHAPSLSLFCLQCFNWCQNKHWRRHELTMWTCPYLAKAAVSGTPFSGAGVHCPGCRPALAPCVYKRALHNGGLWQKLQVTEGASADSDTTSDYSRWVWFDLICEILSWKVCTEGIHDVVELSQMQTLNRIDIFSRISQILIKRA